MKINLKITLFCFFMTLISFRSVSMGLHFFVPYYHLTFQFEKETETVSPINWMTMEEAVAQHVKDKSWAKKFLIDIYTDWCGWCKRMDKLTFTDPKLAEFINTHFYPVKLNAEQKEHIEILGTVFKFIEKEPRGHHSLAWDLLEGNLSYPSIVFLNERFERIIVSPGYVEPPQLLMTCHFVKGEHYTKQTWEDYQKEYKAP